MDALEFYVGNLEATLAAAPVPTGVDPVDRARLADYVRALEDAARSLITAWDAENTPPER